MCCWNEHELKWPRVLSRPDAEDITSWKYSDFCHWVDRMPSPWLLRRLKFQFSCLVVSDPLWPMDCSTPGFSFYHQLPEPTQTRAHWVSDAIQPSHPLASSSHLQSFPASGSFPVSRFFPSGGQSIGVSVSASVLPMSIQDWFPLNVTSRILCNKHDLKWPIGVRYNLTFLML